MHLREKLYKSGVFATYAFNVPVISVGNLTMGGSGKTPTVEAVARLLLAAGYRPAVISRGYKGTSSQQMNLVSDGQSVMMDVKNAGDEPVMLARALPGVPVLTGRKRFYPCKYAVKKLGCTALVLDDGFQHLAIRRDINLTLFNATTLAGNSRVFPGGELREPISALFRSDAFVITGVNQKNSDRSQRFAELLQKKYESKPVYFMENVLAGIYTQQNEEIAIDKLPKDLLAFSGIAHPQRFHDQLVACNIPIAGAVLFPDHVLYGPLEIERLISVARKHRVNGLITTEKDFVKLEKTDLPFHLFYLKMKTELPESLQLQILQAFEMMTTNRFSKMKL